MAAKKGGRKKVRYTAPKMNFANVNTEAKDYRKQLYGALHFAQYEMNTKALAKAVFEYAKTSKASKATIASLRALDEKRLEVLGKYATILVGGGTLDESVMKGFEKLWNLRVSEGAEIVKVKKAEAKKTEATTTRRVTVQDRMRDQAAEVACEFDAVLDKLAGNVRAKAEDFNPLGAMQKAEFKAGQARYIEQFYADELAELKAALAGKDEDLKEGYSNLKKSQLTRMVKAIEDILTAAKMVSTVTKAKRAPRKKKAVSLEKVVSRLKFKAQDPEYGIASVGPINIVGAREVWVFNTRNRKLGRYVAQDEGGLAVKGAYIRDFSEGVSVQKTLRKPKEQIGELMKAGKVQLRKFLDGIKAMDTKLNGKMNEHIVILRVVK